MVSIPENGKTPFLLSTCLSPVGLLDVAAKFDIHARVLFRVSAWTAS
jgi:hypothetical protein